MRRSCFMDQQSNSRLVRSQVGSLRVRRSGRAGQHAIVSRRDKYCLCASAAPAQSGSRACPARHGTRPAPRLAGPSRPTLGPSALAGRRLAAAVAGLRKASERFKHSRMTHTTSRRLACGCDPWSVRSFHLCHGGSCWLHGWLLLPIRQRANHERHPCLACRKSPIRAPLRVTLWTARFKIPASVSLPPAGHATVMAAAPASTCRACHTGAAPGQSRASEPALRAPSSAAAAPPRPGG